MSGDLRRTLGFARYQHEPAEPLRRRHSDRALAPAEPPGKIRRFLSAAKSLLETENRRAAMEQATRRVQGIIHREGFVLEKLIDTIAKHQPTALADACTVYLRSLQEARSVSIYLRREDGSLRGHIRVGENPEQSGIVVSMLKEGLDMEAHALARMALDLDRIFLNAPSGTYSMRRGDSSAPVKKEAPGPPTRSEAVLYAPFEKGMMVVEGADVGILKGGFNYRNEASVRLASRFTDLLHLDQKAKTDPLTGLITRYEYTKTLEYLAQEYVNKRDANPDGFDITQDCAVIAIDVDKFRKYNTNFGHPAGDRVLKMVSTQAQGAVRYSDLVSQGLGVISNGSRDSVVAGQTAFRLGGEEIVVIAVGTDTKGGTIPAERFRKSVEEGIVAGDDGKPLPKVTSSAGVASFNLAEDALRKGVIRANGKSGELVAMEYDDMTSAQKAQALTEVTPILADRALYKAKKNGRNCVYYGTMQKNGKAVLRYMRYKEEKAKDTENKTAEEQSV